MSSYRSISNHKSTESAIKNLEVQVGQLAKHMAEKSTGNYMVSTEKNPKEEWKVVLARSKRNESLEKEERVEGVVEDVSDEEVEEERKKNKANNEEKELRDEKNVKEKK